MPFFRVPFFGSVLVETDIGGFPAGPTAGMWSCSMLHATHGVEQTCPVRPEVKAVAFCIEDSKISEVTEALQKSIEDDRVRAIENRGAEVLAKMFIRTSYHTDLQIAWESFERERMSPPSEWGGSLPEEVLDQMKAQLSKCPKCGAQDFNWLGADATDTIYNWQCEKCGEVLTQQVEPS